MFADYQRYSPVGTHEAHWEVGRRCQCEHTIIRHVFVHLSPQFRFPSMGCLGFAPNRKTNHAQRMSSWPVRRATWRARQMIRYFLFNTFINAPTLHCSFALNSQELTTFLQCRKLRFVVALKFTEPLFYRISNFELSIWPEEIIFLAREYFVELVSYGCALFWRNWWDFCVI